MAEPVLKVEGLTAGYTPEVDILTDVAIDVHEHEIVTIVGPNGAGKSTLMKSVFGLVPPRDGSIKLHGKEIIGLAPHEVTRSGVSYVPQLDNVFPSLTVRENLELGALAGGEGIRRRGAWSGSSASSPGSRSARARRPGRCREASARWWRWAGR